LLSIAWSDKHSFAGGSNARFGQNECIRHCRDLRWLPELPPFLFLFARGSLSLLEICISHSEVRIESDGFRAVADRFVVVALLAICVTSIRIGIGVLGFEPERFGVVGDRQIILTFAAVFPPSIPVCGGIVGFETNRLRVVGNGSIHISLLVERHGAMHVSQDMIGIEP
jgi:hypothetical protein